MKACSEQHAKGSVCNISSAVYVELTKILEEEEEDGEGKGESASNLCQTLYLLFPSTNPCLIFTQSYRLECPFLTKVSAKLLKLRKSYLDSNSYL